MYAVAVERIFLGGLGFLGGFGLGLGGLGFGFGGLGLDFGGLGLAGGFGLPFNVDVFTLLVFAFSVLGFGDTLVTVVLIVLCFPLVEVTLSWVRTLVTGGFE